MNPLKSIHARFLNYKASHFASFPEGRALAALKDIHMGRRCFIIGNGPSLRAEDLDKLKENGDITFAFNRIYHIFDQTTWRPTYYISQDGKMLSGCADDVAKLEAKMKFIPAELVWYEGIRIPGAQLFHIVNDEIAENVPDFSRDISRKVCNSKTVVFTAIQLAVFMGIREIYLIGVDHHFHTSMNAKGEIVVDPTAKDYFAEKYNEDKENLYIPNTDVSTLTFVAARRFADEHGIRICNATRGGKLEVFERVDFESLF